MMQLDTEGWVMNHQVKNLCQTCSWKTQQGAMATCSVYENAWPVAKRCSEYEIDNTVVNA